MPHSLTRREFLYYSAAVLAALGLVQSLPEAAKTAVAAAPPRADAVAEPAFTPLPAPTLLGAPIDVAAGTDGVLWVLGNSGAPSTYDPQQAAWLPFGGGIDAAAYIPFIDSSDNYTVALCFFRGAEVYQSGTPGPVPIASLWPQLPPSFQQGVDGATYLSYANAFYLFCHGQAALVDAWGTVNTYPLTDFGGAGWPGGAWQDGRFDFVISGKDPDFPGYAIFVRGVEFIVADLGQGLITAAPQPLSAAFGGAALALLQQGGLQAGLFGGGVLAAGAPCQLFAGPVVYTLETSASTTPPQTQYLAQAFGGWPQAWHPVLRQTPAGSSGALWSVTEAGTPIRNDVGGWSPAPLPDASAAVPVLAIDCGADGGVYAVTKSALFQLGTGGSWTQVATPGFALQAIAVGDSGYVWVTDDQGAVYRVEGTVFTPANLGVPVGDVAANPDGTLWHCRSGDSHAYRYVSEGQQPSEQIALGTGVTSVTKVASTRFGAADFLAVQNGESVLFHYTSPYAFKTSNRYWSGGVDDVAVGAASVFLLAGTPPDTYQVVALDAQTGVERWTYMYPTAESDTIHFAPVFDPAQALVYVFMAGGAVTALNAHTGSVVWALQLAQLIAAQPLLGSSIIYIPCAVNILNSPDYNQVYMIAVDAADATRRAAAGQTPVIAWENELTPGGSSPILAPPVYQAGNVYCWAWSAYDNVTDLLSLYKFDALTGAVQWSGVPYYLPQQASPALVAPVILPASGTPLLVVNTGQSVMAFDLQMGNSVAAYVLPDAATGVTINSTLELYDRAVYFTDTAGLLYGLDANLNPVAGLPSQITASAILSGLRILPDAQGQGVVIFGDPVTDNLNFYSIATGNSAALATNQTQTRVMSPITSDGMLYVGGWNTQDDSLGQIFAIRANDVSGLRDFVIESQLLQDYDPGAAAVARYQTHIMIVDEAKTPQPFTSVKIWADTAMGVQIDGQPYTIGPDAPAATSVDASGTLTILSDASDLFTSPLRIWAAFMDPFERILVYPDREFHARLPGMIADPNNDDPTVINLAVGTNYAGTLIFSNQQQAQALATTVATTCRAAGIGASGGPGVRARPAVGADISASVPPFAAYADLPGMQYTPYNTPALRRPAPQGVYGASWSDAAPDAYAVLPFAAAAGAIDSLVGEVDPLLLAPVGGGLGSIFSDLWQKIKRGIAKVTQVIVSVGNAVYAGIQYVENGITKVFRFVVRQIEDLAATIGAFFLALGKVLADIVELLSLLLHFEQVVKTHAILKSAILAQFNNLPAKILGSILPAVHGFFGTGEGAIEDAFCKAKQQIVQGYSCGAPGAGAGPAIGGLDGIGATPHTIFSVTPASGGSPKSHAVAATWGFDKVRSHYKQGATPDAAATADNPVLAFANSFAASLSGNGALQESYSATLRDFAAAFTFKSPAGFLQMALFSLLDVIQDLLISSLAVGAALLEGILGLAEDLVTFLLDPQQGILLQPLDIPILADLYKLLFGSELTFLDLVVLVTSIPVTFVYRIIEGQWLSEQIPGQTAGAVQVPNAAQVGLTSLERAVGLFGTALFCGRAILMPINDTSGEPGAPNPILAFSLAAISAGFFGTTMITATGDSSFVLASTALALIIIPYIGPEAPGLAAVVALARIGTFILKMAANPSADALLILSGNLLGSLPPLAQPLKYLNNATDDISLAILLALEIIGNFGAAAVDFVNTTANWDAEPTALLPVEEPLPSSSMRVHLPFVQAAP